MTLLHAERRRRLGLHLPLHLVNVERNVSKRSATFLMTQAECRRRSSSDILPHTLLDHQQPLSCNNRARFQSF
jgi:hypothetical protein